MTSKVHAGGGDSLLASRLRIEWIILAASASLAISACSLTNTAGPDLAEASAFEPTAEPDLVAAPTTTPVPLQTLPQGQEQEPEPTLTATPTPTHPLMIEVMRQQEYPGSEVVFEQAIDSGASYERFIVSYQSEGNKIFGLLTIPRGQQPPTGWPVIIFNHGFIPPGIYRTTERYVAYQHGFANSGYITFRSDYRGHGKSEGIASGGYSTPAYTVDVLNGMAAVKNLPQADPNRIGMWGHSMGGQITLRAMVVSNDIKAGVIWGGVVGSYPDLLEYWRRPSPSGPTPTPDIRRTRGRWRVELIETYGYPEENPLFWASISPNSYLTELSGPIQLHHATGDKSVPFVLSELLYAEMLADGMPVELHLYEGDDHDITANFDTAMTRSIQFFDTYVKGQG